MKEWIPIDKNIKKFLPVHTNSERIYSKCEAFVSVCLDVDNEVKGKSLREYAREFKWSVNKVIKFFNDIDYTPLETDRGDFPEIGRTPIPQYKKVFNLLLDKTDGKCVMCSTKEKLTIDHIKPVSKGGTNDIENLQILCQSCNSRKGAKYEEVA